MATACPIKFINESQRGAPVLSGTAGSLVAILDALLNTGWGELTATSATVADGIATINFASGSFERHAVVLIQGATPSQLNGEARVLTAGTNSITVATTAAAGAASGTITVKYAPAGWGIAFSSSNKRVYRSSDIVGSRFFYRVDDLGTTSARIRGYESMSDIDSGTGPCPTEAQAPGGGYQEKSSAAGSSAVQYEVFASPRFVLLCISYWTSSSAGVNAACARGWGDLVALAPGGDAWAAAVSCGDTNAFINSSSNSYKGAFDFNSASGTNGIYLMRAESGLGGAVKAGGTIPWCGSSSTALASGSDTTFGVGPSPITGDILTSKRVITSAVTGAPRAEVPGLLHIPQSGISSTIGFRDVVLDSKSGKLLRAVPKNKYGSGSGSPDSVGLVDITGPWHPA